MRSTIRGCTSTCTKWARSTRQLVGHLNAAIGRSGEKVRRYLPESGLPYEVFDQGVLLFTLGLINYVVTEPSPSTLTALQAPLHFYDETTWGVLISTLAVVGMMFAYSADLARAGLIIVMCTAAFWCGSLFYGFLLADAGPRALMSAIIYGSIASRMRRVQKQSRALQL